jgi:hypothetical protein
MPLLQDQELAQFFTNKTKEWEDKEERPLRAPRMPPKDRGKAVFPILSRDTLYIGFYRRGPRKLTEVHRMAPRGTGSFSS